MQIILNTDDILRLVLLGLKSETGLAPVEIHIGPIDGEIKAVAGVGEEVPQGTFDDDDTDPVAESEAKPTGEAEPATPRKRRKRRTKEEIAADEAKAKQAAEAQQPQQQAGEAEAKGPDAQQPETKGTETEEVLETKPETGSDKATSAATATQETAGAGTEAATDLFADTQPGSVAEQPVEAKLETQPENLFEEEGEPESTTAASNPFGGEQQSEVSEDSLDLFSDPAPTQDAGKPVTSTEEGFVKPAGGDAVLDLFD